MIRTPSVRGCPHCKKSYAADGRRACPHCKRSLYSVSIQFEIRGGAPPGTYRVEIDGEIVEEGRTREVGPASETQEIKQTDSNGVNR